MYNIQQTSRVDTQMKVLVTNPALKKPLEFELDPRDSTNTLLTLISKSTSLDSGAYSIFCNSREVTQSDTLRSLLHASGGREPLSISLVLCMRSGFFVVPWDDLIRDSTLNILGDMGTNSPAAWVRRLFLDCVVSPAFRFPSTCRSSTSSRVLWM